jgi:hypothetical protein
MTLEDMKEIRRYANSETPLGPFRSEESEFLGINRGGSFQQA